MFRPSIQTTTEQSLLEHLPSVLRDIVVSFLPLVDQIGLEIHRRQIGIHSVDAIHLTASKFGYPPVLNLLDDRTHYDSNHSILSTEIQYIWFHDSVGTNRLINEHMLQFVVLVSTARGVLAEAPILHCPQLKSVAYVLPWITGISGSHWMAGCCVLESVDFLGLSRLKTVSSHWMYHCTRLVSVHFTGIDCLESVGDHWMHHCHALTTLNFSGLNQLTRVGSHWLQACHTLESPDFSGLSRLHTVKNHWMSCCHRLETPNFMELRNLRTTGTFWMAGCASLTAPVFEGLVSITHIGSHWMSECPALLAPRFMGLRSTTLGIRRLKQIKKYQ